VFSTASTGYVKELKLPAPKKPYWRTRQKRAKTINVEIWSKSPDATSLTIRGSHRF
jgi:hypothetical protein